MSLKDYCWIIFNKYNVVQNTDNNDMEIYLQIFNNEEVIFVFQRLMLTSLRGGPVLSTADE